MAWTAATMRTSFNETARHGAATTIAGHDLETLRCFAQQARWTGAVSTTRGQFCAARVKQYGLKALCGRRAWCEDAWEHQQEYDQDGDHMEECLHTYSSNIIHNSGEPQDSRLHQ
jgi:hypothetical protein